MDLTNTKVGPFSWAILTFEHGNLFTSFKHNGKLPLKTFQALFLPDAQLIALGLLDSATLSETFVPDIQRDVHTEDFQLSATFQAMGIEISCTVKAAMDQAVSDCSCDETPHCGACGMHGMFTDLCGEGYANCVASGCN